MNFVARIPGCFSSFARIFLFTAVLAGLLSADRVRAQLAAPQSDPAQADPSQSELPPLRLRNRTPLIDPQPTVTVRPIQIERFGIKPRWVHTDVTPTCKSPKVSYFGGPVISNVEAVAVFWNSDVEAEVQANMGQFFSDMSVSSYMNVLSQYGTLGLSGGTDQWIGNGTPGGSYVLTPSKCAAGSGDCPLQDTDIQNELNAQIAAGHLPAPTYDALGNDNTVYMTFFPPLVTVEAPYGEGASCVQFCAYHNTGTYSGNNQPLVYGVMMDEYTSACSYGCGEDSTALENSTDTASHEFAESITDADIGLDTQNGYANPAAWGDNNNNCGEIADICDSGAGDTFTVSGRTWTVQELWSNVENKCVSVGPLIVPFVLSAPANVNAGSSFSASLTVQNPAGGDNKGYTGTVHFSSSDPSATLPADYTFYSTAVTPGYYTFPATLVTGTSQTITATDTRNPNLTVTTTIPITQPNTAAALTSPASSSTLAGSSVKFTWSAGYNATAYQLWIGSTGVHSQNLYSSGVVTATSAMVNNLPLNGATLYARLYTSFNGTWVHADYTFTAASPATLTGPGQGSTLPGPYTTFTWTAPAGANAYQLWLGTTGVNSQDLYSSGIMHVNTTLRTNMPTNGQTIYARLYTDFNGAWVHSDYMFTSAQLAAPVSPAASGTLPGPVTTFTWTPATGASANAYQLWIGSTGVGSQNVYSSGVLYSTSVTRTNMPVNGETLYARLYTDYTGVWVHQDYMLTAAAAAVLTSPSPGNTLSGANVQFTWSAATGSATQYQLWLGTAGVGSNNFYSSGPIAATSLTRTNMPTNGVLLYARLYTYFNGTWTHSDYAYTEAP